MNVLMKEKTLNDYFTRYDFVSKIETIINNEDIILNVGYFIEIYTNPEGTNFDKYFSKFNKGKLYYFYINKEINLKEVLKRKEFENFSFDKKTLSISIIPSLHDLYDYERNKSINITN